MERGRGRIEEVEVWREEWVGMEGGEEKEGVVDILILSNAFCRN